MKPSRRTIAFAFALAAVTLSVWPAVASAHGTGSSTQGTGAAVPFLAAVGLSTLLSVAIGFLFVRRYRSTPAGDSGHERGPSTGGWMTALLILLGLLAVLSAVSQRASVAVGGVVLGGTIAWLARSRGVSPHDGCADAAFGAVLVHRTVEGVLVAGVYVASAAFGLLGLALLTLHAIGETVAIGGLYAPVSRGWSIVGVVGIHLGFLVGALVGQHLAGVLSPSIVTSLLAGAGGVLLATGVIERRTATKRRRHRLERAST